MTAINAVREHEQRRGTTSAKPSTRSSHSHRECIGSFTKRNDFFIEMKVVEERGAIKPTLKVRNLTASSSCLNLCSSLKLPILNVLRLRNS